MARFRRAISVIVKGGLREAGQDGHLRQFLNQTRTRSSMPLRSQDYPKTLALVFQSPISQLH